MISASIEFYWQLRKELKWLYNEFTLYLTRNEACRLMGSVGRYIFDVEAVFKKACWVDKTRIRWTEKLRGHRKIPLSLLLLLQIPCEPAWPTGRHEVVFVTRSKKELFLDMSKFIPNDRYLKLSLCNPRILFKIPNFRLSVFCR